MTQILSFIAAFMGAPAIRVRPLPNRGPLHRTKIVEIAYSKGAESKPTLLRTSEPFSTLIPQIGKDEALLVVSRAEEAWTGGVGPWVSAFSGDISSD